MQYEDSAIRAGGTHGSYRGCEKMLAQCAGYDFRLHQRFAEQNFAHRFQQFGLPDPFDQPAARLRRRGQSQNCGEAAICEDHALGSIHDKHAFHHAAQNDGREIAFFGQGANGAIEPGSGLIQGISQHVQRVASSIGCLQTKIALGDTLRKCGEPFDAV